MALEDTSSFEIRETTFVIVSSIRHRNVAISPKREGNVTINWLKHFPHPYMRHIESNKGITKDSSWTFESRMMHVFTLDQTLFDLSVSP